MSKDAPHVIPTVQVTDCGLGHACNFCDRQPSCRLDKRNHDEELIRRRLDAIAHVVLVMSNKGGVGKSTTAANLAVALALRGHRTGLADADSHGPNQPRLFGLQGQRVRVDDKGIGVARYTLPGTKTSIALGSLGFFLPAQDTPVVWRDAHKYDYIQHMLGSFAWGDLDYLVIDMPPGTGNELITVAGYLESRSRAVVLVSTADALTLQDSLKAARYCLDDSLPVIGVVENQAGLVCPHCHNEIELFPRSADMDAFERAGIATLARVPFAREIGLAAENAVPFAADADSVLGALFAGIAERCHQHFSSSGS